MAELSPMMKQYMEIKKQHEDHVLFFRLGDFYEMFFDDAKLASKELELTLTGKDCGQDERAPMCGVPYHSCEAYIARLVAKGYKVAICEQTEDAAAAKGIVRREVIRVITPGTVIEGSMLDETRNNYICSICLDGDKAGLVFVDISTGEAYATELTEQPLYMKIINEIGRFTPSEALLNSGAAHDKNIVSFINDKLGCVYTQLDDDFFDYDYSIGMINERFSKNDLHSIENDDKTVVVRAIGALLGYVEKTQKKGIERLNSLDFYLDDQYMNLDITARRNLELVETMRTKEKRGTLLWVIDKTKTAMGKRLIRNYIEQPLLNIAVITKRQNAVSELYSQNIWRNEITEALSGVYDLERLMTRVVYGTATPREIKTLSYTCASLPVLKEKLKNAKSSLLSEIHTCIDELYDIREMIDNALVDDPPASIKDGGVIKDGYNREIDELRNILVNGKDIIASIEAREKEKTGIKNLKIGYNKVFGYYLEVTRSYIDLVPDDYIRKQTLSNCERYITQELKDLETKVLTAKDRIIALENELFDELKQKITLQLHRIQNTATAVAKLDVLCSFAQVSVMNNYVRPDMTLSGEIRIKAGRHPVIEAILDAPFVPNDTLLDNGKNNIAIITGPNMAGKSTYMRQVALIVLMAQIGCFVPAESATITVVDSIFTRVGASDDLASGQSTFMVEMNEVSHILKNATSKSLLILDEIGRGTSTFDGMSIARAVVEYIADKNKLGAKTLFATHYHELTELEGLIEGINNYNVAVKKRGDDITFLRRIVRGGADDSYGIEVAKLAGISDGIIKRAKQILAKLEASQESVEISSVQIKKAQYQEDMQMALDFSNESPIKEKLKTVDVNTLTPIEALNLLYELKKMAD